jgi:hypothetical protein
MDQELPTGQDYSRLQQGVKTKRERMRIIIILQKLIAKCFATPTDPPTNAEEHTMNNKTANKGVKMNYNRM